MSQIGQEFTLSDEDMQETLNEIQAPEPIGANEIESEVVETPSDERPRDEKGRFVATKEPGDDPDTFDEVAEPETVVAEATAEEDFEPEPDPELVNPPATWTPGAKAKWDDLPEWAKREALKREDDSRKGVEKLKEELGTKAEQGERLLKTVEPYMPIISAEGGTAETAIGEMLNSAYILRQGHPMQKAQMAFQLAEQYGFLNELFGIFQNGVQNTPQAYDPRVDELERKLAAKESETETQSAQAAQAQIDEFASATDEAGKLLHPYFDNLKGTIASLLQTGEAEDLESAYERAVWSHPETRPLMLQQQATLNGESRQVEAKERARKAEKANKANPPKSGKHSPSQPAKPLGSVDDTMRETYEQLVSR